MAHYYDLDPNQASNERTISYEINGQKITLISDDGVFSKNRLDEGSALLLKTILPLNLKGNILDVGCGYGPIGLTIAITKPDVKVTCVDINPRAVSLCNKNINLLSLSQRVTCLHSDIYENVEGPYDSIVANPPIRAGKKVTYQIYREARQYLIDGGCFYFVIRKAQGAESASKYVKEIFGNIVLLCRKKGYLVYKAVKQENQNTEKEPL